MLKRTCKYCNEKTLEVPMFKSYYACTNCFSRFVQPSWFRGVEILIGAMFGTMFFYILLFYPSWLMAFFIFIFLPISIDVSFKLYGPIKLTGLRAMRRNNAS